MVRYWPLIVKNTLRNRRRTLLTILSIGASFCLLGVLMAMYHVFFLRDATADQSLRLITRNRVSLATVLPYSYLGRIRTVQGVREVMILQWFGGTYKDNRDMKNMFSRFAVEPRKLFVLHPEYRIAPEERMAFERDRTACVLGRPVADRLGLKLGDRVSLIGDIYPVTLELTIRGLYESDKDSENLFLDYEYLRESVPRGYKDFISMYHIMVESPRDVGPVADRIDALFRNSAAETKTETEKAFELSFLSYIGDVKMFLLSICGALTFTVMLVAANTVAMSVRERVREVGVLKTLGYTLPAILGMLLTEAVIIALAGAGVGLALAAGILFALRQLPSFFVDMKTLQMPPSVLLVAFVLAILVGVLAALIPAWTTSRQSIVACLRVND